jgi:hypothetical protein
MYGNEHVSGLAALIHRVGLISQDAYQQKKESL